MPFNRKRHPEAEALFKCPQVGSSSDQAQSARAASARAVQDKTAKLKTQRLAKETTDREAASNKSLPVSKLNASDDT